ncbi:MAG: hypothetical protein EBR30_25295, partial [Cytophagia bacterium]|nr:hypothetical protein [Cytophagia bacterium]
MKSFFMMLLLCTVGSYAFAQWNPNNQTTGNIYYNGGNVGIGTVSPYSKLNIMDNGISINASDQFNGGL